MNEEIKEKLEELKDSIDYPKIIMPSYDGADEEEIDNDKLFSPSDCKVLLDYIEQLKTRQSIVEEKYKIVDEINQRYKEVIDKLKEWINIVQQNKDNKHLEPFISTDELDELLDILKEVSE